jgi:serine protease Do
VINGAGSVLVKLASGREFAARLMGTDPPTDIALLKIDATNLPALHFGSSRVPRYLLRFASDYRLEMSPGALS